MQVRVYNNNKYPYRENFKGEDIVIDAGAYMVMDNHKAEMFVGSYSPAKKDPQGRPDPLTFKMLEIKPHTTEAPVVREQVKWICNADGTEHASEAELKAWEAEHHLDKLSDQKVADDIRKKKK